MQGINNDANLVTNQSSATWNAGQTTAGVYQTSAENLLQTQQLQNLKI
jgi:hypothetical protein